jgi:hypothetical protein
MNLADLAVRSKRLEQLSMNLSGEELRVSKGRVAAAFRRTARLFAGVEKARVVLAGAKYWMAGVPARL